MGTTVDERTRLPGWFGVVPGKKRDFKLVVSSDDKLEIWHVSNPQAWFPAAPTKKLQEPLAPSQTIKPEVWREGWWQKQQTLTLQKPEPFWAFADDFNYYFVMESGTLLTAKK